MASLALITAAMGVTQALQGVGANRQAKDNADLLKRLGVIEANETRREVGKVLGAQRAAMAKSGGQLSSGSNLDLQAETAAEGEYMALRRQFGFESRAYTQELAGRQALISGITSGVGTILGGSLLALGQTRSRTTGGGGSSITTRNNSATTSTGAAYRGIA